LAASFANLNAYSPDVSISNSGVSFAPNRVQSLTLNCVRYYTSDGQVFQDNQSRAHLRQRLTPLAESWFFT
jgi:hypothetical protein